MGNALHLLPPITERDLNDEQPKHFHTENSWIHQLCLLKRVNVQMPKLNGHLKRLSATKPTQPFLQVTKKVVFI